MTEPLVFEVQVDAHSVAIEIEKPLVEIGTTDPVVVFGVRPVSGASGPQGPAGPEGPQGPAGSTYEGLAWFYGVGPPETVVGSKPGDRYLDTSTGTIYALGDN